MLFRAAKNRKFGYIPSFYDEKKNQDSKAKFHQTFSSSRRFARRKKPWLGLLVLLIIITLLFINLNKMRLKSPQEIELDKMEVVK